MISKILITVGFLFLLVWLGPSVISVVQSMFDVGREVVPHVQ